MDQPEVKATVSSLERRLGVYVPRTKAEEIAARWRELGHKDVRIEPQPYEQMVAEAAAEALARPTMHTHRDDHESHNDPDDWRDHAIDAYESAKGNR